MLIYDGFAVVPRPGIEPGWIAPLVFETSASTDSAIWAWRALKRRCKDIHKFEIRNFFSHVFFMNYAGMDFAKKV